MTWKQVMPTCHHECVLRHHKEFPNGDEHVWWACDACNQLFTLDHGTVAVGEAGDDTGKISHVIARVEMEYRKLLWLGHGHLTALYGDDGEMQCTECVRFGCVDYLRDPLEMVEHAANQSKIQRLSMEMTLIDQLKTQIKLLKQELGRES